MPVLVLVVRRFLIISGREASPNCESGVIVDFLAVGRPVGGAMATASLSFSLLSLNPLSLLFRSVLF